MNIILCDDERNFAEALREEIKNFFDNKSMQVNITWYGSGEELLKAFEGDRKSTRLNSSHKHRSRMPSSA